MQRLWMRAARAVSNPLGLGFDRALVHATGFSLVNQFYARAGGFAPRPCLLLTTRHHATGVSRRVVLPYVRDGDDVLVVGSHGGRPRDAVWARNLRVHADCRIRIGWRNVEGVAREARDEERERVWGLVTADGAYVGYAKMAAPRVIPVFVLSPA